jgi:hypothetical protein
MLRSVLHILQMNATGTVEIIAESYRFSGPFPDKRDPCPYPGNRWLIKAPDQIQSLFQDLIARPNMAKYDLIPAAGKPAQNGKLAFIFPIHYLRIRKKG